MESVSSMKINAGIRIGYWKPGYRPEGGAFNCVGFYYGPDLGDLLPGAPISWNLMDGELKMKVGVLFRPDLGKRQRLETILIITNYVEEMWEYDDFQQESIAGEG